MTANSLMKWRNGALLRSLMRPSRSWFLYYGSSSPLSHSTSAVRWYFIGASACTMNPIIKIIRCSWRSKSRGEVRLLASLEWPHFSFLCPPCSKSLNCGSGTAMAGKTGTGWKCSTGQAYSWGQQKTSLSFGTLCAYSRQVSTREPNSIDMLAARFPNRCTTAYSGPLSSSFWDRGSRVSLFGTWNMARVSLGAIPAFTSQMNT